MQEKYDVIIIGGGAMGLSAAAALTDSSKKVLVLERFGFFNEKGSSAGLSRQFRIQYAQKYMAELVLESIPFWEKLQQTTSDMLIDKVGSLWFGDPAISSQEGGIEAAMNVMDELKVSYEPLDAKQIEERFPFRNLPKDYSGFFQKEGGIINLKATLQALYNIADNSSNVKLREYEPVTGIDSRADGSIHVQTEKGPYETEKLILTPGAYTNELLKYFGLSMNLDIWEMSSAYYKKTENIKLPTWFVFQEPQDTSLFYGFPEEDWANPGYIRVAPDLPDRILIDPKDRKGVPSDKSLKLNNDWVADHMYGLEPEPDFTSTCLITLSNNNKELLLDTLPEWVHNHENIIVYTGGWAAKFIPLLGQILAELALEGKTKYDISNFKINWPMIRGEVSQQFVTEIQKDLKLDVAIVGGGASGLYSGYRLKTGTNEEGKSSNPSVGIFEMSDRVGGRLESIRLPGMSVVGELGGMRYMTVQEIVTALIEKVFAKQYSLKPIPFPMGDSDHHLMYLRKQRFFKNRFEQAEITGESFETRYFVEDRFKGKSSDTIFTEIISEVLEADGYSLEQIQESDDAREKWNEVKQSLRYNFPGPYQGQYVYEIGFWNLLKDRSSQETYEFLAQAGGYYSNTINWNAAEAFPYMVGDFASSAVTYKTLDGGYDQILTCLADAFLQKQGTIYTKNRLVTFGHNPDTKSSYRYLLTFYSQEAEKEWTVLAKDIILAMPRRSLELLDQENFFFNRDRQKELHYNLDSVIMEPSYKILLGFEEPWWEATLKAKAGESITDLPMRQCYYFGVDPENSHSLFLGSYNDMRTVAFWQALENGEPYRTRSTKLVRAVNVEYPSYQHATRPMVLEVMKQVRELHGPSVEVPEPYTSAFKDWTDDPYGGGYHAWKDSYKVWEVMPYIRQPYSEERVFITGEAYSDQQGWVEGAFCVAEHVMREKFDLKCPDWLNKDYYLGW
ncbi:MAG TPA: FAD-dependent oxidoreductase [Saprospiraceae bacterium]|nr:FAD-dependent oxidoreductase [Saprospiraceae bacterium]